MSYETDPDRDSVERLFEDGLDVELRLADSDRETARVLERALEGRPPAVSEGTRLLGLRGKDLAALVAVADSLRREAVGDRVTYVINRNLNWTNVCFVGCKFCAFARLKRDGEAYDHSMSDLLGRIEEAVARGATEVCMQGGLNPAMPDDGYVRIIQTVRSAFPDIHIHAFSPMEIMYGAHRARRSYGDFIDSLIDAGLDSMPGTAAEILDDDIREVLSHKKLPAAAWEEIVRAAHGLGLPTTSTLMYGHIESPVHIAAHLDLLRRIQADTGGFTEFVPLRFIWKNTALYREGLVKPVPQGQLDLAVYAVSRLMLSGSIDNLQTSWVKIGHRLSTISLLAGCNDLGGTLMEESISREAGADAGVYTSAEQLETMIKGLGRIPTQRDTLYRIIGGGNGKGSQEARPQGHLAGGWGGSGQAPARPGQAG